MTGGDCALEELPSLCQILGRGFNALDVLEATMTRLHRQWKLPGVFLPTLYGQHSIGVGPHLATIPMLAEACLTFEVQRLLCKLALTEPKVRELVDMTKKRFIRWLKVFIEMMIDPQFNAMTASRHTRALLLSTLDLFPDWVQVSTEAARQTDKNEGPYAVLGLSWDDLKKLHGLMVQASLYFACSSRQQSSLAAAMASSSLPVLGGVEQATTANDLSAKAIVEAALEELLG